MGINSFGELGQRVENYASLRRSQGDTRSTFGAEAINYTGPYVPPAAVASAQAKPAGSSLNGSTPPALIDPADKARLAAAGGDPLNQKTLLGS
jgi:hypothetical protein